MRLTDDLAARRMLYPEPVFGTPRMAVIDIAPPWRGDGLSLGRYVGIVVESDEEAAELEAFLTCERPEMVAPDLLDRRPSAFEGSAIMLIRFAPPVTGWPWLLLCYWPRLLGNAARDVDPDLMARGAYTIEMFVTEPALDHFCIVLLANLREKHDVDVRLVTADRLPPAGTG